MLVYLGFGFWVQGVSSQPALTDLPKPTLYLDPKGPTFLGFPSYDFLKQVLKKVLVGSSLNPKPLDP